MGYGPGGVDAAKPNNQLESWVGPPEPISVMQIRANGTWETNTKGVFNAFARFRKKVHPAGPPPWSGPGGQLRGQLTHTITVAQIRAMIQSSWAPAGLVSDLSQDREYMAAHTTMLANRNSVLTTGKLPPA
ncbi:hypothetical protein CDD82_6548 [Ophiocordyceps australis]|uniref:Uncharacterized protein n=1 Tax=Ophiocordyceps australis TaxID=1399860 RepID=A0A2C5XZT0_9HYPO|nr:hypothetical protein CDD82_6548 [Ophiocordyceps australis]